MWQTLLHPFNVTLFAAVVIVFPESASSCGVLRTGCVLPFFRKWNAAKVSASAGIAANSSSRSETTSPGAGGQHSILVHSATDVY